MTGNQIRQQFLDFFASKRHAIVDSSPVVPHGDPTLMFTNAGMNQFKDVFLGTGDRPYKRAADTQKCIRAGGKHNDLDDVGQDTYHHTYFEMLGNWSFGDYFKKEAIAWAWELLTEVWGFEKDRLHATYFQGDVADAMEPDTEAAKLWRTVTDIDPAHIHGGNQKDNFWEMGDTGPCGPCSEIHVDLTPDKSGASLVNAGDPRVIELWNLVFIQFNRDVTGHLTPLPAKHVDTGMGFERLVAMLQSIEQGRPGALGNYDTDVFAPVFDAIRKRTAAPAYCATLPGESEAREQVMIDVSYRVIADHLRCLTFALTDGAIPSNEGRGYVLRRILRRAVRYGRQCMNMHEPFLCDLVEPLVNHMVGAFPELRAAHNGRNVAHVCEIIRDEEASFGKTLDRGIKLFNEAADHARKHHHGKISGEDAFKLHDTYGFPIDLTELMAEEQSLTIDIGEYERRMEAAREIARQAAGSLDGVLGLIPPEVSSRFGVTDDSAKYSEQSIEASAVCFAVLGSGGTFRQSDDGGLAEGSTAVVVLDRTNFYAEQGGQIGDCGLISTATGRFTVESTQWVGGGVVHFGRVTSGQILPNQKYTAQVDSNRRRPIMRNHTSTHLLNWALRAVLGDHVQQKGSLVDQEKTRFDFSHNKPVSADEMARIETLVNERIDADLTVYTKEVDQAAAREINTLRAVFGEKYPDRVRVVSIGAPIGEEGVQDVDTLLGDPKHTKWMEYSVEFCGGTHLKSTADAQRFVITHEEGVAKGIRRVVGISGDAARAANAAGLALTALVNHRLEEPGDDLATWLPEFQANFNEAVLSQKIRQQLRERISKLQDYVKKEQKKVASASVEAALTAVAKLFESADIVNGVTVVVGQVPHAGADALRASIDWVRNKADASAVLLATSSADKVTLVAGMSKSVVTGGVRAGELIKEIAPIVGGRGGGRPDLAQGGGNDSSAIPEAIMRAKSWLSEKL